MNDFKIDGLIWNALGNAEYDTEAAAKILKLAAPYLIDLEKRGELPLGLGQYLANAFILTAREAPENRPKMLARTLNLTALHRRPKNHLKIGDLVDKEIKNKNISQYAATLNVIKKHSVSRSYAQQSHAPYIKMYNAFEQLENLEKNFYLTSDQLKESESFIDNEGADELSNLSIEDLKEMKTEELIELDQKIKIESKKTCDQLEINKKKSMMLEENMKNTRNSLLEIERDPQWKYFAKHLLAILDGEES